ncbi:MAG: MJ1477/TM1410 family putative glycoside hydrolase [Candidatus Heimdallarchaeaceae archaeon]
MQKKIILISLVFISVFVAATLTYLFVFVPKKCLVPRPSYTVNDFIINDFGYQLQDIEIEEIAESEYDLIIIDYSIDGSDEGAFSHENVSYMKTTTEKILLSYMSIGEAENYRFYWNNSWDADDDGVPDPCAPSWLDRENPEWEGNYKVHYWDPEWQKIIFGTSESYLDKIISAGFDGVYLDIIDAYEYYEEQGRTTARDEMIDFVVALSIYAKNISEDFLIVPQNGEELLANKTYRNAIDGIGREDVFYMDNSANSRETIDYVLSYLSLLKEEEKFVLIIDYPTLPNLINKVYCSAYSNGFLAYVGPRDLNKLAYHKGFLPD